MDETKFRNKVTWFVFGFSILVIWVHSYNAQMFPVSRLQWAAVERLEGFLGYQIGQIAVPGFFMISGYLFYRTFRPEKLREKWKSRIRSILIPYFLWNVLYYLGYVIGSRIWFLRDIVGKGVVPVDIETAALAVFHYEYNYVFWYLYQLIWLIALAPLIYWCIRNRRRAVLCLFLAAAGLGLRVELPQLNLDALFYYMTAAGAAVHGKELVEAAWSRRRLAAGCGLVLLGIVCALLSWYHYETLLVVAMRLVTPAGLWLMIPEERLPQAKPWMEINFFIYAVHFAFVRLVNKTAAVVFLPIPAAWLAIYLALPALTVAVSYPVSLILRKKMPRVWNVLTGGR